jgi:tetratricopeptide (TPR) repeat protein
MSQVQDYHRQAIQAINQGNYPRAKQMCQKVLKAEPRHADALFLLGIAEAANMNVRQGLEYVDKAIAIAPDNAEYMAQKAKFLVLLNQPVEANNVANAALALQPENAGVLDTLGVVLSRLEDHESAAEAFRRVIKLKPDNPQYHFNLASSEQFLGHVDAARSAYEKVITLKPDYYRAYWALSELEKNKAGDSRLDVLLKGMEKTSLKAEDYLYLGHAISREYEQQGDYDKSYEFLEKGKRKRKIEANYSYKVDERIFEAMQQAFKTPRAENQDAQAGKNAIFIIGMPRSGTTLVERILDSHSEVKSLGELQNFAVAVKRVSKNTSRKVLDEEVIRAAVAGDVNEIKNLYLSSIGNRIEPGLRFIDKMPLNFLYVGFILSALPAARIICLKRNPMDVVISNYRQLFAITFSYYNYHYDLTDTAMYYTLFDKLMRHWTGLYSYRIHELSYETLTAEPEPTIRSLLDYLDLDWDPACLDFHKNPSAVSTASAIQVREPLYRSSVGRWVHYAKYLEDLKVIFERASIDYDLGN